MNVTNLSFPGPQNQELPSPSLEDDIFSSFGKFPRSNYQFTLHPIEKKRWFFIQKYIQDLAPQFEISSTKDLSCSCAIPTPGFSIISDKDFHLHPSLVVFKNEMPPNLRASSLDERLDVSLFENWLHEKFDIPKNSYEFQTHYISMKYTKDITQFHARLQQHPEMHRRILQYMITEAFIRLDENKNNTFFDKKFLEIRKFLKEDRFLLFLGEIFLPIFIILDPALALLSLLALTGLVIFNSIQFHKYSAREKEITFKAIKLSNDYQAVKIFYNCLKTNKTTFESVIDKLLYPSRILLPEIPLKNRLDHLDQAAKKLRLA